MLRFDNPQLSYIRLAGIMEGEAWGGFTAEREFAAMFQVCRDEARSGAVRQDTWLGLDEALQRALSWGDVIGGQGDLVDGWIEFHLTARGPQGSVLQQTICKRLEDLKAAQPYLAAAPSLYA